MCTAEIKRLKDCVVQLSYSYYFRGIPFRFWHGGKNGTQILLKTKKEDFFLVGVLNDMEETGKTVMQDLIKFG